MEHSKNYRIAFEPNVPLEAVEDTLVVSAIVVESLLGRAAFKLDATYHLDREARICVVDASTVAGQHVARVFVGLMAKEFGERAFTIRREAAAMQAAGGQAS